MTELPRKEDKSLSESTFTSNIVSPLLRTILKVNERILVEFPNTESQTRKKQGLKPDRPDIVVKVRGVEMLFGEISGPRQDTTESKEAWDRNRLARFGKCVLDDGHFKSVLLHNVNGEGTYLELTPQTRGVYLLDEVGYFRVPTAISSLASHVVALTFMLFLLNQFIKTLR
ncbi:MAG: hypothetical protein J3Q66DRAFT_352897 [Benniella sp.]|nr:MAG: hypothetical protein J3Q66DRAFT_352897 [Benniella sp.]